MLKKIAIFLLLLPTLLAAEEPWGKDCDLLYPKPEQCCTPHCKTPILGPIGERLVLFHKKVISPADGPRSHYIPNSSQYTLDAMRRYNFFVGVMMGCDRLMRENPDTWVYRPILSPKGQLMKWNPVP